MVDTVLKESAKITSFLLFHKPQPGLRIEFSAVKFSAAIQARHRAFDPADARKFLPAAGATIEKSPGPRANRKGQRMAARFLRDTEITACPAPLRAVRRDSPRTSAELREQMRELMAQGAIDLGSIVFPEPRVERDQVATRIGAAGRAEQASVPFHVDFPRELLGIERLQDFARLCLERRVTSENDERARSWKNEVELSKQWHTPGDFLRRLTGRGR